MNAIVDIQGFKTEQNQFILKEIAIKCEERVIVLLIKPPYPFYNLTKKERLHVHWIEKHRGILWNEGFVPQNSFKSIILKFLKNKRVFTKGFEKTMWLKEIVESDRVFNLEDYNCPNFETLYQKYSINPYIQSCIYHSNICALKNVSLLSFWCVENKILL